MGEAVARIIFSMLPYVDRVSYSVLPELYSWQEVDVHLEYLRSLWVTGRCITGIPSETRFWDILVFVQLSTFLLRLYVPDFAPVDHHSNHFSHLAVT